MERHMREFSAEQPERPNGIGSVPRVIRQTQALVRPKPYEPSGHIIAKSLKIMENIPCETTYCNGGIDMTWRGILDYIRALTDPGKLPNLEEWQRLSVWNRIVWYCKMLFVK